MINENRGKFLSDVINSLVANLSNCELSSNARTWGVLRKHFSKVEKEFSSNVCPGDDNDNNLRVITILKSFLTVICFKTNYWKLVKDYPSRYTEQLNVLFKTWLTMDYDILFTTVKEFYSTILNFNSECPELLNAHRVAFKAFLKIIPYGLKVTIEKGRIDWKHGRSLQFLYSINQMKKGFRELTKKQMVKSIVNSIKTLTEEPEDVPTEHVRYIQIAVRMILQHPEMFKRELVPPSKKSTLEYGVAGGGGFQLLSDLQEFDQPEAYRDLQEYFDIMEKEENKYEFGLEFNRNVRLGRNNKARIALLVEANKVRFLTIQSVFYQTYCRDLQQYLIDEWKLSSYSTMHENAEEEFKDVGKYNQRHGLFNGSSDYTDATNLLKPHATRIAMRESLRVLGFTPNTEYYKAIMDTVSQRDLDLNNMIFVNHPNPKEGKEICEEVRRQIYIWDPRFKFTKLAVQRGGQLMGNPLSFPILCMINLSTFLRSKLGHIIDRIKYQDLDLDKTAKWANEVLKGTLKINGDDSFSGFKSLQYFNNYRRIAKESVGLVVNHKTVFTKSSGHSQINNILIKNNKRIRYLNLALFFNNNIKNLKPVLASDIKNNVREFEQEDERESYIIDTLERLNLNFRIRDWFISESLGGLGIDWSLLPACDLKYSRHTRFKIIRAHNKKWEDHFKNLGYDKKRFIRRINQIDVTKVNSIEIDEMSDIPLPPMNAAFNATISEIIFAQFVNSKIYEKYYPINIGYTTSENFINKHSYTEIITDLTMFFHKLLRFAYIKRSNISYYLDMFKNPNLSDVLKVKPHHVDMETNIFDYQDEYYFAFNSKDIIRDFLYNNGERIEDLFSSFCLSEGVKVFGEIPRPTFFINSQ